MRPVTTVTAVDEMCTFQEDAGSSNNRGFLGDNDKEHVQIQAYLFLGVPRDY